MFLRSSQRGCALATEKLCSCFHWCSIVEKMRWYQSNCRSQTLTFEAQDGRAQWNKHHIVHPGWSSKSLWWCVPCQTDDNYSNWQRSEYSWIRHCWKLFLIHNFSFLDIALLPSSRYASPSPCRCIRRTSRWFHQRLLLCLIIIMLTIKRKEYCTAWSQLWCLSNKRKIVLLDHNHDDYQLRAGPLSALH